MKIRLKRESVQENLRRDDVIEWSRDLEPIRKPWERKAPCLLLRAKIYVEAGFRIGC
jgi:hypothetical protein